MKYLNIDASQCTSVGDFYDLLMKAIGAPEGHGSGPDAFNDSMIWGGMNSVEPPYTVRISGTTALADDVKSAISEVVESLKDGRRDHIELRGCDVEVSIEIVS